MLLVNFLLSRRRREFLASMQIQNTVGKQYTEKLNEGSEFWERESSEAD